MDTGILIDAPYDVLAVVGLIGIGHLVARWRGIATSPLPILLRVGMGPVVLLTLLNSRVEPLVLASIAGIAAVVAVAGFVAVSLVALLLGRSTRTPIPAAAAFAVPCTALGWVTQDMEIAVALFVGTGAAAVAFRCRGARLAAFAREPWLYAVVVAVGWHALSVPTELASEAVAPLAPAAMAALLLLLGATMVPIARRNLAQVLRVLESESIPTCDRFRGHSGEWCPPNYR